MPLYTIAEMPKAKGMPLGSELTTQTRKSEDRFHVGDKLVVPTKPNQILKIAYSVPADNPAGQDVTYVVEYMSDLDKQAGGDIVGFPQYYLNRKRTQFWT